MKLYNKQLLSYMFSPSLCWGYGTLTKWYLQMFYWVKCFIVLALNKIEPCFEHDQTLVILSYPKESGRKTGGKSFLYWIEIAVGPGLFKNWYFTYYPKTT